MNLCKEHGTCFPCPECERIRSFSLKALSISAALAMLSTLVVLWVYRVMDPPALRVISSVEALLFLGLMWAYRRHHR